MLVAFSFSPPTVAQEQKLTSSDGQLGGWFGRAIGLSGDLAIVGAPFEVNDDSSSGAAYIFERVSGTWTEKQKLLPSDGQLGDRFGMSVAISGDYAIVGAPNDDDVAFGAGATYVYRVPSFSITLKKLIRTAAGTKKVKIKWNPILVNKGKIDFYVNETPDGSFLKRTANDGGVKLKLPTSQFPGDGPFAIQACEKNSTTICSNILIADFSGVPIDFLEGEDEEDDEAYAGKGLTPEAQPAVLALLGNHPNPFNPRTTIRYALPERAYVALRVYDVLGRLQETLVDGPQEVGTHAVLFDATHLPSGLYVYRLEVGSEAQVGHMLLLK